jgi:hypothetical protein
MVAAATDKAVPPISTAKKRWDTTTLSAWSMAAAVAVRRHCGISGSSRAAGAALLQCTAMVGTKTPMAKAMVGAQTTINNPLKAAEAMGTIPQQRGQ